MKTLKTKLISRKFLTALAGLITGLAMIFGIDEAVISAVVAYIITEGRVDAARAAKAAENVVKAVEAVDAVETAETAADGQQSGGIAVGWTDSDISPDNQ